MLFRRPLFLCVLLVFMCIELSAQVNLQTGSANFSLPVFNWKDDKGRLTAIVALNYNSGNGLKADEVASSVGQGWSLVVGGSITRLQVGEPDDQLSYSGNGTEKDIRKYPPGYLYSSTPAYNGCPDALTRYPIYESKNQVYKQHNSVTEDKQPDYFSFQFNGKSGLFVLDKEQGSRGIMLGDSRIKISFVRDPSMANNTSTGIRTTIKSFSIQDVDGLIYRFAQLGTTKVLENNYCDANLTQGRTQPKFSGGGVYHQAGFENSTFVNPYVIGSWHLTEIEDPLTLRKVTFSYVLRTINNVAGEDISYNKEGDYTIITHKTSVTRTPDLSGVNFPDGHSVLVNYGNARADLAGQFAVASVDVKYQSRFVSRHQLNTTYFILNRYGTPSSAFQKKVARLCLKSVVKYSADLKEDAAPYIFDYYTGSNTADDFVPPPFSYLKDIWGFYNGSSSVAFNNGSIPLTGSISDLSNDQLKGLCFLRNGSSNIAFNPKTGYAKNGLLRQVIYPTGSTLTYQYEQNTGVLNGASTSVGGVHVSQTSTTDGGYSNPCASPLSTLYYYVMNGIGSASSLWGLEMPLNSVVTNSHYNAELKKYKYSFPFGQCYWKYSYPGILSQNQAVSLTDFQKFMEAAAPVLGIISIVTTVMDVINLVCYSSGTLAWVAVIVDIIGGLITLGITCFSGNHSSDKTSTVYYNLNLHGVSPLPTQFKRVEVVENPGTIGKVVHEFTSDADYPVWEPTNPNLSAKQRFAPWAYGLPKLITTYNAAGAKLKETENIYDFGYAKMLINWIDPHYPGNPSGIRSNLLGCKCVVSKNISQRITDWNDPAKYNDPASYRLSSTNDLQVEFYGLYTGRAPLTTSKERVYKTTDATQFAEAVTTYYYHHLNYQVFSVGTRHSNGDETGKYIKYPVDFTGGIYDILVNNNILNVPVVTTTSVSRGAVGSPNRGDILESTTNFVQLANGDIKPSETLEKRYSKPTVTWETGAVIPPQKVVETFTYDASGNLIGVKDEGKHAATNIFDYQDKFIVASVMNAEPALDKPAYTSFETNVFGGWQLTGAGPGWITNSGVTGTRAFNLASNTLTAPGLNTARAYTVSFWSNAAITVTGGATLKKTGPAISGYTFYEYDIAQGTTSVALTGNAYIDEVRIYPATARMRTVSYDPLIGKTADCDENNRISYYEYDNMGRLRFIKDANKNITKMYEYNNVAKQNGCPGTYSSKLTTETFTRNNCGAGYIGGNVTYTVPANKYTSTISQEDADNKVDNEIFVSGQAYANTNGACILLHYNDAQSRTVTSENCPTGYKGGNVTYTVPANRYYSTVSKAAANQMAIEELDANAQAWANNPANAVCVVNTDPDWEWDGINSYCQTINGQLPAHAFVLEKDVNPNSSSYNQTRWNDVGPESDLCPPGNYYNAERSQVFYRNDCGGGSAVTYTVPTGRYSSATSQAAADQLAQNDINANGQAYANTNGTCCQAALVLSSGISSVVNYTTLTGSTVNFTWVFTWPAGSSSFILGNINNSCAWPTSTRTVPIVSGGSVFNVTIYTNGSVYVQLVSGPIPSSVMGLVRSYDRFTNAFYSAPASGYFTRNDCPPGQVGSSVQYSIPQYQYSSLISQADADQQAQTALQSGGQNYANSNGTCNITCTFSWASGISGYTGNLSNSGTTVQFQIVFPAPSSGYYGGNVGTISTGCRPSGTRYVTLTDGANSSRQWYVTIQPNGNVSVSLYSGPAPTGGTPPIVLNGSFTL